MNRQWILFILEDEFFTLANSCGSSCGTCILDYVAHGSRWENISSILKWVMHEQLIVLSQASVHGQYVPKAVKTHLRIT